MNIQASRYYNPRTFVYVFAGSLTVILVYVLTGHLPSRQGPATFQASHIDSLPDSTGEEDGWYTNTAESQASHIDTLPDSTEEEDGWYTSTAENPYGKEGVDVSEYLPPEMIAASNENMKIEHIELQSQMTKDGKWFTTDFVTHDAYNPGFLPHAYKPNIWVMFGQRDKSNDSEQLWNSELVCEAVYHDSSQVMRCMDPPVILPIASTFSADCGDHPLIKDQVGPHDARVMYGPKAPYIIYGTQHPRSCLGQYMHDLRRLTPFMYNESSGSVTSPEELFFWPTALERPPPVGSIEKNWFAFWDMNNEMYLHYDTTATKRSFAKVLSSDKVSEDLAPLATGDPMCIKELMPSYYDNGLESIHQATNSLQITLCDRSDPTCHPTSENTFIMILFHRKTSYMHGVYFPFIMLFRATAPFEVYGISSKPFWYNGRGKMNEFWRWSTWKPKDQTQTVFTTQMSWFERRENGYHGYLDDRVLLAFGIEDRHGGGIDVTARDLLQGMKFCSEVGG